MTSRYALAHVDFADHGRGWAVAANGTIFRYSVPSFTPGLSDGLRPLHFARANAGAVSVTQRLVLLK